MELVTLVKDEVYCDSAIVAKKFKVKHANFLRVYGRVLKRFGDLKVAIGDAKFIESEGEYRGQKFKSILMNRQAFSLVSMRFETKEALEWQVKFNQAFYELEKRVIIADKNSLDPKFLKAREQGIEARRKETDIIKVFVGYATKQGSTKASFYYKHITNATYKALGLMFQRKPKLRDTMDIYELAELLLCETFAKNALKKYMDLGRNYQDVYESVRDDLVEYANNIRNPMISK